MDLSAYVAKHGASLHRGKLIGIAQKDDASLPGDCRKQAMHKHKIDHGCFIHDHHIGQPRRSRSETGRDEVARRAEVPGPAKVGYDPDVRDEFRSGGR